MGAGYGDIIFFAVVAVYLGFKLFSILGKKNDQDDKIQPRGNNFMMPAETAVSNNGGQNIPMAVRVAPQPEVKNNLEKFNFSNSSVKEDVKAIIEKDPQFSLDNFIEGAKLAFEMLLKAYSEGDKKTLRQLLSDDVYNQLEAQLDRQASVKHISSKSLVAFENIEIEKANITGSKILMKLKFLTEQISTTKDENGNIIEGDPKSIVVVEDSWEFERNLKSSNPNWTITAI